MRVTKRAKPKGSCQVLGPREVGARKWSVDITCWARREIIMRMYWLRARHNESKSISVQQRGQLSTRTAYHEYLLNQPDHLL